VIEEGFSEVKSSLRQRPAKWYNEGTKALAQQWRKAVGLEGDHVKNRFRSPNIQVEMWHILSFNKKKVNEKKLLHQFLCHPRLFVLKSLYFREIWTVYNFVVEFQWLHLAQYVRRCSVCWKLYSSLLQAANFRYSETFQHCVQEQDYYNLGSSDLYTTLYIMVLMRPT
jgi:hypothetical protein